MKQNQFDEAQPSAIPSDESQATSESKAAPSEIYRQQAGFRTLAEIQRPTFCENCQAVNHPMAVVPYIDVRLCPFHGSAAALFAELQNLLDAFHFTGHGKDNIANEALHECRDVLCVQARNAIASASTQVTCDTRDNNRTNNCQASPLKSSASFTPRDTEVVAREVWNEAIAIAKEKTWWGDKANPEYINGVVEALEAARDRVASPDQVVAVAEEENTDSKFMKPRPRVMFRARFELTAKESGW